MWFREVHKNLKEVCVDEEIQERGKTVGMRYKNKPSQRKGEKVDDL